MSDEQFQRLRGQANLNSWHFRAPHGPLPNPVGHTFPLLSHDAQGRWRLVGTGFYISDFGLFVTAAHVVEDVLEGDRQVAPLVIMHLRSDSGRFGPESYLLRPIGQCWIGETADVVLGAAAEAINNQTGEVLSHWSWPLEWDVPSAMAKVVGTYAFPNHSVREAESVQFFRFDPDLYPGTITEIGEWRDRVLVPYPYMHGTFHIHGAASGGPVTLSGGGVIGINCRFMNPDGPGVAAQIRTLQDAFLDDVILLGESVGRRVGFSELVAAGAVTARHYSPNSVPKQAGRIVRFDQVLPWAPRPQLEVVVGW